MRHVDEHTLELYALNAQEVRELAAEIEAHLAECIGCRLLFEEIAAYHAELAAELAAPPVEPAVAERRLARRRMSIEPFAEAFSMPVSYTPRRMTKRLWLYFRNHPVGATAGTLASLALLALGGFLLTRHPAMNPAYVHYNVAIGRFEVNTDHDETIWSIPLNDAKAEQEGEILNGVKHALVADLDGDGINEVVTAIKFPSVERFSRSALRIFDNAGSIVKEIGGTEYATFDGLKYDAPLVVSEHFVMDSERNEFYLVMSNGRSPTVVRRLDKNGNTLGEYWHYGQVTAMYLTDVDKNARRELVLTGINDLDDTKELSKPVFAVLDPWKIVGRKEATSTRGFGLPPSDAELFYVRLPFTEINFADNVNAAVNWMRQHDSTVEFDMSSQVDHINRDIDFSFSRDLRCLDVKPTTLTLQRFQTLYAGGKIKHLFTPGYRMALINGVTYWNGSGWTNERTGVRHPSP